MALERGARPDLVAGTISLTSNSLNFTVSGIDFDAMSVRSGDTIITRAGLWLVIDQITSATAGTLAFACPASAAGNDQPLRIRFQPEGSRLMGMAASILSRFNSGNIMSIADLDTAVDKGLMFTGAGTAALFDLTATARLFLSMAGPSAANKMPYFSAPDAASLTDLTEFARSVMATPNAAAMWAALGGVQSGAMSGYVKFPNKYIFQWGTVSTTPSSEGLVTVPLPTAYTSNYSVFGFNGRATAAPTVMISEDEFGHTLSSFRMRFVFSAGSNVTGPMRFTWQTMGL